MKPEDFLFQQEIERLCKVVFNYFESKDNVIPFLDEATKEDNFDKYNRKFSQIRYYKVAVMCGHVGKQKYIRRDFGVKAKSKKQAIARVLKIGKTKKSRSDAILHIYTISREKYKELKVNIRNDLYEQSRNVEELVKQGLFQDEIREIKKHKYHRECHKSNLQYKRRKMELKYEYEYC